MSVSDGTAGDASRLGLLDSSASGQVVDARCDNGIQTSGALIVPARVRKRVERANASVEIAAAIEAPRKA